MPDGPRYEDDFYAWAQYQADLPRLYARARRIAGIGLQKYGEASGAHAFPEACSCTIEKVLADDWYPAPPQEPK